jgi:hypothetical protein
MEMIGVYYYFCDWEIGGGDESVSIATDLVFSPTTVWAYPMLQRLDAAFKGDPDFFIAVASVDYWYDSSLSKHYTSYAVFEANCRGVGFWAEAANCHLESLSLVQLLG